jgi:putative acetyltransferase
MDVLIRSERPTDKEAIEKVTAAAFAGKPYSNGTEHLIVDALRDAEALSLSLVAEINKEIVGHIGFSLVSINGNAVDWYGIGPVSVSPKYQLQGIGSKLIKAGLAGIREMGAKGCVLEGSPEYYQRFGFKTYPNLIYAGAPAPEYFMALPFYDEVPHGNVEFHKSFYITAK